MNQVLRFKDKKEYDQFMKNRGADSKKRNLSPSLKFPGPVEFKDRYRNKMEREYAAYLAALKHMGEIVWWSYESWGFRLADNTFIYPDFPLATPTHIEIHDTKGHMRAAWWAKFKTLKELYPIFKYAYVKKEKGNWVKYYV